MVGTLLIPAFEGWAKNGLCKFEASLRYTVSFNQPTLQSKNPSQRRGGYKVGENRKGRRGRIRRIFK